MDFKSVGDTTAKKIIKWNNIPRKSLRVWFRYQRVLLKALFNKLALESTTCHNRCKDLILLVTWYPLVTLASLIHGKFCFGKTKVRPPMFSVFLVIFIVPDFSCRTFHAEAPIESSNDLRENIVQPCEKLVPKWILLVIFVEHGAACLHCCPHS